jgi:plastocyanin
MEYSFTFTTAGTFDFFCVNHGAAGGVGMSGTVIVEP